MRKKLSRENEEAAVADLMDVLQMMRDRFPTSIEEDEKMIRDDVDVGKLSHRQKLALMHSIEQKKTLDQAAVTLMKKLQFQ